MTLTKWKTLQELVRILRIPYTATIALQNPRITLSDVFGIWTKMTIHLEALAAKDAFKTELSQKLLTALNNRKVSIFNTPEMECSLFLDPRFRGVILDKRDSVERARAHLINLWSRINSFQAENTSMNTNANVSSEFHFSFDEQAELNRLMNQNATNNLNDYRSISIEDALDLFQPDWIPSDKSVLEFWESQKHSLLYNLAMAVYSLPPTQVKIEQNFSSVGHVFNERRFRLSEDQLHAILLIHLNKDIFKKVKQEKLDALTI